MELEIKGIGPRILGLGVEGNWLEIEPKNANLINSNKWQKWISARWLKIEQDIHEFAAFNSKQ